jgi:NAD(P)-dependent dehydrogenase (short-subunit alcohol dehydrogenase family)
LACDDPRGAGHRGQPRHRRELAWQLALRGDAVVLTARELAKAEQAPAALPGHGHLLARRLDVTDPASAQQVAADLDRRYGRLDVLVDSAAIHYDTWQQASTADLQVIGRRWRSTCSAPGRPP